MHKCMYILVVVSVKTTELYDGLSNTYKIFLKIKYQIEIRKLVGN
jgi:hypothetical protein